MPRRLLQSASLMELFTFLKNGGKALRKTNAFVCDFSDRFYLSFFASTIALWKVTVTFTAIFLRNKVVHSVFCVFAIKYAGQ